ncbi:uncharacterized protein LOC126304649 [Schistocerca gregaria]|uniref:uncharacterized protein LOC126304649 n=1 Tax=Schistocerca gregaria TaxID=7010 RepID=UPI00211EE6BC|nr:uncharacterized protein LOC126304649 [Schistocerca gregaria]
MKSSIIGLLVILLVSLVFVAADESNFISDLLEEFPGVYEFRKYAANQYCFGNNNFKCNSQGKITEIQIENINQNGHVPVSISTLTELHKIDISNSSIELDWNNINNIKKLDILIFSGNKHKIVKFPTLTIDLKYLDLSNTRFDGELTKLPSTLLYINISNTGLTGSIPSFINNPNLRYFDVSNNKLKGDLPDFDRTNLLILNASNNMLN